MILRSYRGKSIANQGCQIFPGPNIPKREKYLHQMTTNYTKTAKGILYQKVTTYTKQPKNTYINIFHSRALKNIPKLLFLVLK
jgi:hypothetical protein